MEPSEKDIQWARKHGWIWDGEAFAPRPMIRVIPSPGKAEGWCPWWSPLGALQMEAPFGNVRAALRVAEAMRRQRQLGNGEMNCSEALTDMEVIALAATPEKGN